ncbi:MAG TPA: hypothetical protein VD947_02800, partial [Patescibacteria group bacterium]|nr:hypothetical protein [Patescibacteria group bacterium]
IKSDKSIKVEERLLQSAGFYDLKTEALKDATNDRDVEGLLIKAVELMHNLDNPPPDNPASTWRDCIEITNCYSPALDLFGFTDLAMDLRGKALEFFSNDPHAHAKAEQQHKLSAKHFDFLNRVFDEQLEQSVSGKEAKFLSGSKTKSRVKTLGSKAKKFRDDKKYEDADKLPDGIGFRRILPDSAEDAGAIAVGERVREIFSEFDHIDIKTTKSISIRAGHPLDDKEVDDYISNPRNGYQAYHIAFIANIEGDEVPFEVQVVTETMEKNNTYAEASAVWRKTKDQYSGPMTKEDLEHFRHIASRANNLIEKPMIQELNPHTWHQILRFLPELPTRIHNSYKRISTPNASIMVPHELEEFAGYMLQDEKGLEKDIFLPPSKLTISDFYEMIGLIDPSLKDNEQIESVISLLLEQDLGLRRSGLNQLEGHLLPVAFHAGIMAALVAKHWEKENSSQFLADVIIAALLHDLIEDVEEEAKEELKLETEALADEDMELDIVEEELKGELAVDIEEDQDEDIKAKMEVLIRTRFGDHIADTMMALSAPEGITHADTRRKLYAEQIGADIMAPLIKLSDRMHNHVTDLVCLATSNPDEQEIEKIRKYFRKTITYLAPLFNSDKLPKEYQQVYRVVMDLSSPFR